VSDVHRSSTNYEALHRTILSSLMLFVSVGCDHVSELQPPTRLLLIPYVICEHGEPRWNDIDSGNRRTWKITYASATLSTINSTWTDRGANLGLRSETPATYRQVSYFLLFGPKSVTLFSSILRLHCPSGIDTVRKVKDSKVNDSNHCS
jgi:hypothetical protein